MVSTMGEVYWMTLSLSTLIAIDCSEKKGGFTRSTNRASGLYLTGAEPRKPTVEVVEAGHDGDANHEMSNNLSATGSRYAPSRVRWLATRAMVPSSPSVSPASRSTASEYS